MKKTDIKEGETALEYFDRILGIGDKDPVERVTAIVEYGLNRLEKRIIELKEENKKLKAKIKKLEKRGK